MKILHFLITLEPAGAERVVSDLSRGLVARGHEVEVLSLFPLPPTSTILDELRAASIPVHSLGLTSGRLYRALRLRKLVRRISPDVVHTHIFHPGLLMRLLREEPPPLVVHTIHASDRRRRLGWRFLLDRLTSSRCDAWVAVSEATADFHAGRTRISREHIRVILNGIGPPAPLSASGINALREEWGFTDCERVLGSVGRLDPQKGYRRLLELLPALARRLESHRQWGLVILGEGPDRTRLEELALKVPPNLRVIFPGYRPDAASCIGAFDLFLMPSVYEGFGLTFAEAMAHGIPAVVSPVDSLTELARHYPPARTLDFETTDADTFATTVIGAIEPLPPRLPAHPFPLDGMIDAYEELYRELVDGA